MITMIAKGFTLFVMVFLCFSIRDGGSDNCPPNSTNLIRMCRPATITNKNRYTMEFADFELTSVDSCRCFFIAPSRGNFDMAPTSFNAVNNCGTKIVRTVNNIEMSGGTVKCKRDPFLGADAHGGETVAVTISTTSKTSRIAPYCYVATFPANVTFTCTSAFPEEPTTTTVTASTATTRTPSPPPTTTPKTTTTTPTTTSIPTTTTPPPTTTIPTTTTTTTTPSTSTVISSSATSPTKPSSTSDIHSSPNRADDQESVPMTIVIPAAVGGVVVIILIIVIAVVCSRRSKSPKQTSGGGYQNEVFNDKDSSSDGIKDNVLYNSMDANYPDMNGKADGHYSSVIRHSTKLDEDSHKMKELPQSANQEPQGPVYAVVDKGQKRPSGPPVANKPSVAAQSENANAPVYAVPDKSQSKAKQSQNALYDVPKNNSPVASPVRTSNQDGLLYSEIEHVGQIPELPSRKSDPKPNDTVVYSEVRTEL